jgi:hypothetical protein
VAYFRKKPVIIEAFRLGFDKVPDWFKDFEYSNFNDETMGIYIHTLEGNMLASKGDWVIKGLAREVYACKHDIFVASYEEVKYLNEQEANIMNKKEEK